jgi:hypothetical protein
MCKYCGTDKYRKIYVNHYGSIPKESNGRSYEIHHVDGNHSNNDPDNLIAVTLQEHYDIHYRQGDWAACHFMSIQRLASTPEEISTLSKKANSDRLNNGTHNFQTREDGTSYQQDRVESGEHHFIGGEIQRIRIENGTHHFLDSEYQKDVNRKRVENGTHNFLDGSIASETQQKLVENGNHHFLKLYTCDRCERTGKGPTFKRHHFDKCKSTK